MNRQAMELTRRTLHGLAELVLAGPQYAETHEIALRVTSGGFATTTTPHLRVEGLELVAPTLRLPLDGTFAELATAAGVEARALRDVYDDGPGVDLDDQVVVDPQSAALIAEAFARGDAAMRAFAPAERPVLWPEHFDVGITVGEVNYGVSPGDEGIPEPYAYVGPWTPRVGAFWNSSFGAAHPIRALPDAAAVQEFFRAGAAASQADPPRRP
jgi:hypothetical protein